LPLAAWNSLHDEGITTIDQLKAAADRLERMVGIGSNMARVIRAELTRVSAPEG
jgi:predicted flap endonuclease-1-like 5' DNA nuclease